MKRYQWKPLLLIIPFLLCILICAIADHPDSSDRLQLKVDQESSDQKENTEKDIGATSTERDDQNVGASVPIRDQVPIDPIQTDVEREEPDDPEILTLVIGMEGSMVDEKSGTPIYEEADEDSQEITKLQFHCAVIAHDQQYDGDWVHVKLMEGYTEGYVKREDVNIMKLAVGDIDPVRDKIVKDAVSYLGLKFVRYGKSLTDGIDCSNFVEQIYAQNGIDVPNTPMGLRDAGIIIDNKDALPGDIVFYDKANQGTGHVGIYLGHGIIINSSGHSGKKYPDGGVRICCILYPDRDSFLMVDLIDADSETGGEDE